MSYSYDVLPNELQPRSVLIELGARLRAPTGDEYILQADLPNEISIDGHHLFFDFMQDQPPDPNTIPYPNYHVDHPGSSQPDSHHPNWALFVNLSQDPEIELCLPYVDCSINGIPLLTGTVEARSYVGAEGTVPSTLFNYVHASARDGRTARGIYMPLGQLLHVDCKATTDYGVPMARYSTRMNPLS